MLGDFKSVAKIKQYIFYLLVVFFKTSRKLVRSFNILNEIDLMSNYTPRLISDRQICIFGPKNKDEKEKILGYLK